MFFKCALKGSATLVGTHWFYTAQKVEENPNLVPEAIHVSNGQCLGEDLWIYLNNLHILESQIRWVEVFTYLPTYFYTYLDTYLPKYLPTYQWISYLPTSTKLALKLLWLWDFYFYFYFYFFAYQRSVMPDQTQPPQSCLKQFPVRI